MAVWLFSVLLGGGVIFFLVSVRSDTFSIAICRWFYAGPFRDGMWKNRNKNRYHSSMCYGPRWWKSTVQKTLPIRWTASERGNGHICTENTHTHIKKTLFARCYRQLCEMSWPWKLRKTRYAYVLFCCRFLIANLFVANFIKPICSLFIFSFMPWGAGYLLEQ